jgi:hypothetical protein
MRGTDPINSTWVVSKVNYVKLPCLDFLTSKIYKIALYITLSVNIYVLYVCFSFLLDIIIFNPAIYLLSKNQIF